MHPARTVRTALELAASGANATMIARQLGISRSTVRYWLAGHRSRALITGPGKPVCNHCNGEHDVRRFGDDYAYLLGLYLGDGCISMHPRHVYRLRIVLDVKYPGIIRSAAATMGRVRGGKTYILARRNNCVEVSSYWRSWPCVFPQHGPGKKHEREIALVPWQQAIVDRCPEQLLRGLVESDGCRFQNTGRAGWSWPRYSFMNKSDGIRAIFCAGCDRLGVRWTASGAHTIYVSRKADVAKLDEFIGPKR